MPKPTNLTTHSTTGEKASLEVTIAQAVLAFSFHHFEFEIEKFYPSVSHIRRHGVDIVSCGLF